MPVNKKKLLIILQKYISNNDSKILSDFENNFNKNNELNIINSKLNVNIITLLEINKKIIPLAIKNKVILNDIISVFLKPINDFFKIIITHKNDIKKMKFKFKIL